jgi:hypothetical protein
VFLFGCVTFHVCLQAAQLPVTLNSDVGFAVLASSSVTNTGATVVNGNVGVSPGTSVSGFLPGRVAGGWGIYNATPGAAATAQSDLTTAYNDAAGRTAVPSAVGNVAGDIGGQTLTPGLYNSTSSLGISGTLTLNGSATSVFIFQIGSTLITANGSSVVLEGGVTAANVFWQVGSSATLGTGSTFNGTIMALASVTINTGATLNGRALASNGAVTMDTNPIAEPGPPITAPVDIPTLSTWGLAVLALLLLLAGWWSLRFSREAHP